MKKKIIQIVCLGASFMLYSQAIPGKINANPDEVYIQNSNPGEYTITGITLSGGAKKFSQGEILRFTGLSKGEKLEIPGPRLSLAIKKLWDTNRFSEVKLFIEEINEADKTINLNFYLEDLKTLGILKFDGNKINKSKEEKYAKDYNLKPGITVTNNLLQTLKTKIPQEYLNKGYLDAKVNIVQTPNAGNPDMIDLTISVDKGKRVKIDKIDFTGNDSFTDKTLRAKGFKDTKQKRLSIGGILKPSKFVPEKYQKDKKNLVNFYNEKGFRDALINKDEVTRNPKNNVEINVDLTEGKKYYIGNITFEGNTAFSTEVLQRILGFKSGDVYDVVGFNKKLGEDGGKEDDSDIKSLYNNAGYLFANVNPIEKRIDGDKVDLEIRINEGEKATWNKVTWSGNDVTHDHVILRSLRTKPGDLFSKADLKRTYFELGGLQFFDPQQLKYDVVPNPANNTVDIHWTLVEKPSSTMTLQAGYGGNSFIGTLGVTFNNFSLRNIGNLKTYKPVPQGDGQTLSITAQAGQTFQNYAISFTEPWLFGTKPTALSVGLNESRVRYTDPKGDASKLNIFSANVGLNRMLRWPDDYFSLYTGLQFQSYNFNNYPFNFGGDRADKGQANNFTFNTVLSRNSAGIDPIFPTIGSNIELSLKFTPPYSLLNNRDYSTMLPVEKYKWMEFYKVKMKGETYNQVWGKLVLRSVAEMGFMNGYNKKLGAPPFERFYVGGVPAFGGRFDGRELIPLRGYENASTEGGTNIDITPTFGGTIYNRFSFEVRYPISMNNTAKIFGLGFVEGGNVWNSFGSYNPFQLKRSAGIGVRVYMGAFGLIGFDFAYGFDKSFNSSQPAGWHPHFLMNQPL